MSASELFSRCLRGDREACVRLWILYYLLPRLEKELEEILSAQVAVGPVVPPWSGPDPWIIKERDLVHALLDPDPQPAISIVDQLKASILLRDALTNVVKWLDSKIDQMERQVRAKKE